MKVGVARANTAAAVLAHQHRCLRVVNNVPGEATDLGDDLGQDVRMAVGVRNASPGDSRSAAMKSMPASMVHGCRKTRGWVTTRRNS